VQFQSTVLNSITVLAVLTPRFSSRIVLKKVASDSIKRLKLSNFFASQSKRQRVSLSTFITSAGTQRFQPTSKRGNLNELLSTRALRGWFDPLRTSLTRWIALDTPLKT